MRSLGGGLFAVGLLLMLSGGMDLALHNSRPDLGIDDPSESATERHLAARARMGKRLAKPAVVTGTISFAIGSLLLLVS